MRRFRKFAFLLILAANSLSLAADRNERIRTLSGNFICVCSCRQLLNACNHFNCPSSGPMFAELGKLVDAGKSDEDVIAYFSEKYGSTVLSAPPVSGFNLTAWITPPAALVTGALIAIFFLRQVRRRFTGAAESTAALTKYKCNVEEELKKFSPED